MRIRTIKPEFFTHETLFEIEEQTGLPVRLAFIGLWCVADREGRFRWEPRRLRVQVLPYDTSDFAVILEALSSKGLILRYGDNGEFGHIPSFLSHQCINIREAKSTLPEPPVHARACTVITSAHIPRGVNIPGPLSRFVMDRDDRKCVRCQSDSDLTIDHIFPQCIGGTHAETNLRTLCRRCNSARPVQGQALLDDLARDGLTMADLQRTCTHVHARGEGKGKEMERKGNGKEQGKGMGGEGPPAVGEAPVSLETAVANCGQCQATAEIATQWWWDRDSVNWLDRGQPIARWQSNLSSYAARWRSNEAQRKPGAGRQQPAKPAVPVHNKWEAKS